MLRKVPGGQVFQHSPSQNWSPKLQLVQPPVLKLTHVLHVLGHS